MKQHKVIIGIQNGTYKQKIIVNYMELHVYH